MKHTTIIQGIGNVSYDICDGCGNRILSPFGPTRFIERETKMLRDFCRDCANKLDLNSPVKWNGGAK